MERSLNAGLQYLHESVEPRQGVIGLPHHMKAKVRDSLLRNLMSFVCAKPIPINTWVWWGVLLATIGRLTMSLTSHMWFRYDQVADDWLLMSQSLPDYAQAKNHYRLAKNQSFSMWLSIIYETGINVDVINKY
ncbi:hypothetical protein [Bifidobacterium jacchi]|uniref:Uncharacterized protein n=1 Tax=Bifidobacterium jacchi TaxID=2490545 RepID=A0A5N5RKT4_9BIFI|nr:hypothetical protein [Bifidobacterium jacchi]KAB5607898.1 hypothetical protein EHS19_02880 [Bifidobacterium jacchi]